MANVHSSNSLIHEHNYYALKFKNNIKRRVHKLLKCDVNTLIQSVPIGLSEYIG